MAYLDNQDLWYELFDKDVSDAPAWLTEVLKSRTRFNQAMSILHNYSLLEVGVGQYSLHTCVHDWTLEYLNYEFDQDRYRLAIHCVAVNVSWDDEAEYWVKNRRVLPHARRIQHIRIKAALDWSGIEVGDLFFIAYLYSLNDMTNEAEEMYMRALRGREETLGSEHKKTLDIVNNLGNLYRRQDKLTEAEEMYMRALRGREETLGSEHKKTLDIVNNLGNLYRRQDKLTEAEEMYMRALREKEKTLGSEHTETLDTVNNLGVLYGDQDRLTEAEEMYMRALRGKEKTIGSEHISTLDTVNNLGILYKKQGKIAEAEEMYTLALRGYRKALGENHSKTRIVSGNLENLYKLANGGQISKEGEVDISKS